MEKLPSNTVLNFLHFSGKVFKTLEFNPGFTNRAFQYGDGIFESIRIVKGVPQLLEKHIQRLHIGIKALQLEIALTSAYVKDLIEDLNKRNKFYGDARAKLMVYRKSGGYYSPETNDAELLLFIEPLNTQGYEFNEQGKTTAINTEFQIDPHLALDFKKIGASDAYIKAGILKNKLKVDDIINLNTLENVVESINSNIIILKNNIAISPENDSGALPGIMCRHIMSFLPELGFEVYHKNFTAEDLMVADEIIFCNAIQGLSFVKSLSSKRFFKDQAKKIHQALIHRTTN